MTTAQTASTPTSTHRRALVAYEKRTPESRRLFRQAGEVIAGSVSRSTLAFEPYPFYGAVAAGARVTDVDGNPYLDLVNNYTSLAHGHGHGPTASAAARELTRSTGSGTANPREALYAEQLRDRLPSMQRLRFTTSGSEATGFAVRAARAHTGRTRVLKFEGGFHGSHNELHRDVASREPLPTGTAIPSRPAAGGMEPSETVTAVYNDPTSVRTAFERWGTQIAAVIVEPFLGNASLVTADRPFLDQIFASASEAGALVVFDEVQSLRAGYRGAQGMWGYAPDLTAIGKIMGGGFALAAYGGRADIFDVFSPGPQQLVQTGTFTATPLALAAGQAAMAALDETAYDDLAARTDRLRDGLRRAARDAGIPVHVNGLGSMFDIAFSTRPVDSYRAHYTADADLLAEVRLHMVNAGVLIMPRGTGCLSTAVTDEDVDEAIAAFTAALNLSTGG
ncbi:aminotransferase class III-fold pyridoxal phosphate-dependent enzyme [Actinoplanes sp. NPDC051470]|uniref:aspartate aminotransferase family protein n=1 Tax=Actinoplanes sp. NPDC051470 TaxID=3157224 RepID=UPI003417E4E1